jgi:hypothetical protein
MQASTEQVAPTAPAAPLPAAITTVGSDGKPITIAVPTTREQVEALLSQRSELSSQLSNVTDRRAGLAQEIRNTSDEGTRAGLQDRLKVLDQRILQMETDLAIVGRQLAAAPAEVRSESYSSSSGGDEDEAAAAGAFGVFIPMLILMLFMRRRWKRQAPKAPAHPQLAADSGRLERLEHGMEAIAIEIERVAEGQRFVTKLLSEAPPGIGASHRIAEPVKARE